MHSSRCCHLLLLPPPRSKSKMKDFGGETPYSVMFGPDICGFGTRKTHVIFNYKEKNHLVKKDIKCETDQLSHVYTLRLLPNNTYEVRPGRRDAAAMAWRADTGWGAHMHHRAAAWSPWQAWRPVLGCWVVRHVFRPDHWSGWCDNGGLVCYGVCLQVLIDMKSVENGTLYDDFEMLAPKKIKVRSSGAGQGSGRQPVEQHQLWRGAAPVGQHQLCVQQRCAEQQG